ncbi:hypothetical protein BU17DRAFT_98504 [Hysterangium stoloniferum]|nr:hypothetical protein BU17DRAFT_98504 [Hysterangium stoloniferum]
MSWRYVAVNYSQLWSHIELSGHKGALRRALEWAKRAGQTPLDIVIRYKSDDDCDSLVGWLSTSSHGIKSMVIIYLGTQPKSIRLLQCIPSLRLDRLGAIQILGIQDVYLDYEWVAEILHKCPTLSSMSLAGVEGLHTGSCEALRGRTNHLTHLSISARSGIDYAFPLRVDAIVDMLTCCPGLLSLECHALGDPEDQDPPTAYLPSLRSLLIGDGPDTCQLLSYLNTPQLHTLCLSHGKVLNQNEEEVEIPVMDHDRRDYPELFIYSLGCLYDICSPPIKKIIWERCIVDVNILNGCAPFLPELETLDIFGQEGISLDFLDSSSVNGTHSLFPSLRKVVLTNCTVNPQWLDSVRPLLENRPDDPQRTLPHVVVRNWC